MTQTIIDTLFDKKVEAAEVLDKYINAIEALQTICEHNWEYQGHGHNYSIDKCSICRLEKEY